MRAILDLAASIPRSSLIIDDLAHLTNDALQARSLAAFQKLALWLLRDARAPRRLLQSFDTWIEAFGEAERAPAGVDAITALLTYLFQVIRPVHRSALRAKPPERRRQNLSRCARFDRPGRRDIGDGGQRRR